MVRLFAILLAASVCAGCASYQVAEIDAEQRGFPTSVRLKPEHVIVNKPYENIERARFVVVNALTNVEHERFRTFIEESIGQLGLPELTSPGEYAQMLDERKITDASARLDRTNTQRVYRHVGPFLVIHALMERRGDLADFTLAVYDPESNDTLLQVRKSGGVWLNIDTEYVFPVLNLLREWIQASGGLGVARDSDLVSEPVERTVNGWHVDALGRSTHLASGMMVPGRVVGMRPIQHHAYDGDRLNASVEFQREDGGLWMSLFIYPRFHGMPAPDDELRRSIQNTVAGGNAEVKSARRGDAPIEGVRRPVWAANIRSRNAEHDIETETWTFIAPTRAWYVKVMATEMVRDGVEPGVEALTNGVQLLGALALPAGAFDESPEEVAGDAGFRALDDICERVHCHPPRRPVWIQNDGSEAARDLGVPMPVIDDGNVTLFVGDRVYLEAEVVGSKLANLTAVPENRDPARTITIRLRQEPGEPDTLLDVDNPFDQPLKYRLNVRPLGATDTYPLTSCPVPPRESAREAWPLAMPRLTLSEFRLIQADESPGCDH